MVLLVINDLGMRFFAGGTHDQVGKTLITLCSTIAFMISIVVMKIYAFEGVWDSNNKSERYRTVSYLTALVVLSSITYLFYNKVIIDI